MTSMATSPVVDYLPQASPGLSEGLSPRLNSPGPLPLPEFKFPARRPSPPFPSSAPSSFSRASGRRPLSAFELISTPSEGFGGSPGEALPQFSFGSPSPASPRTTGRPLTAQPHQRNKSEYFGGSVPPLPGTGFSEQSLPPPTASRRHAHRRSAAISQNDLSLILKPGPSSPRGSSAPTSPAPTSPGYHNSHRASTIDSAVQPPTSFDEASPLEDDLSSKVVKNTKVGFSDDVQIIPRPLSMVSSDSASTVRPGHSVSNSMSSVMSGTVSPPAKDGRGLAPNNRMAEPRPRTAEPVLDYEKSGSPEIPVPKRRGSLPLLSEVAAVASPSPSTPRSLKKWSFFGHEAHSGDSSPKSRPTSASSAKDTKNISMSSSDVAAASVHDRPVLPTEQPGSRRSSISRKPSKKQKKVRSWAGSILGRKSRQRSQKPKVSRRSPTPPLRVFTPVEEAQNVEVHQMEQPAPPRADLNTDYTTWKPRRTNSQDECMSPIIDLDAALGPFNTPSSFGSDWDSSQKSGMRKRAMHSAAGLAGFTGPGMHYHRRAESAPEFENPRFGLNRLGSNSTMAMEDVFEEDEEDEDWEDTKASSERESSIKAGENGDESGNGLGIDIKVLDSEGLDASSPMDFEKDSFQRGMKRKGSASSEGERRTMSSAKSAHSAISLMDEPIEEEARNNSVEIVDDSMPSRPESRTQSSDSTATPPFRPHTAKDFSSVDFTSFSLQPPYQTPNSPRSTTQSSIPSPRSPFSYDTQRISTAPSSIADEHAFQSLLLGEPGPELRMSVDDVPSLTSSNSTMTRESMVHPMTGHAQFRDGQRSASLSSAAITRKRGSMASLSRLISSSHGEKSKLSIESKAPNTSESDRKEKASKGKNRISRLMQFWKPSKESSS